jgi:hypothetical protein
MRAALQRKGGTAMGKNLLACAVAAYALFGSIGSAKAEEFGTSAQARAMIQRAIDALKANEGDAIKAFGDKNNDQFHVLDLYVFCINLADGKFTSQLDQSLVGTSAEDLRFGDDQYGKRILSTVRGAPEGKIISVAYNALRPGTNSGAVPKVSFVARVGKQGCGVGYYRQKLQPSQSEELPASREAVRSGLINGLVTYTAATMTGE